MDLIVVKNFMKKFGNKTVHRDINLTVRKGECVGLIGGSGSGKSVILRSLIGLERPDGGQIIIDGKDISKGSESDLVELRKRVAYVFQGGALFDSMNVYENLAYPLREHTKISEAEIEKKILATLKSFGLQGADKTMPANLSGGMQKRVGLARAIILDPEIILYDEPTAGLDPYNTKKIQEKILELKALKRTSVLVTHDMPTAFAVCDRMALVIDGRITEEVTTETLQKSTTGLMHHFISGEEF
jgi:phospholipid/cholesterol/gamma-HCH transport system ATP-binding protein